MLTWVCIRFYLRSRWTGSCLKNKETKLFVKKKFLKNQNIKGGLKMICDMCGEEKLHLYKAIVEGSLLSVCEKCKKFGEVISIEKPKVEEPKQEKPKLAVQPE